MIYLVYGQSPLISLVTIFFYTCFWIPFRQSKQALLTILRSIFCTSCHDPTCREVDLPLPVTMFGDLATRDGSRLDEMCPICLVDFEWGDAVTQLSMCGHIFHMGCIQGWLDKYHFTCPLCRSCLLNVNTNQVVHTH